MTPTDSLTYTPLFTHCPAPDIALGGPRQLTHTEARVPDGWEHGLAPQPQPHDPEPCQWAVALMLALIALAALRAPQLRRIFSNLDIDLLGTRRRANAFDTHTSSETRSILLLMFLGCVCQGILLASAVDPTASSHGTTLGIMMLLAGGCLLLQVTGYTAVGYTFTDSINASQWLKSFALSQALLALTLTIPAVTVLYYHNATFMLVITGIVLYILARLAFLCKGFRIFYNSLPSLVYFILYLCALEIVPVILLVKLATAAAEAV